MHTTQSSIHSGLKILKSWLNLTNSNANSLEKDRKDAHASQHQTWIVACPQATKISIWLRCEFAWEVRVQLCSSLFLKWGLFIVTLNSFGISLSFESEECQCHSELEFGSNYEFSDLYTPV